MKKIIIISYLILTALSCKAQILPIENVIDYFNMRDDEDAPTIGDNFTYIKDVNNLLDKFVGTWIGTYNNKTYELIVVEHTSERDSGLLEDELLIYYKITDANGTIIEDTTPLLDSTNTAIRIPPYLVISGHYLAHIEDYRLIYIGRDAKCGQEGELFIEVDLNNLTQMKVFLSPYYDIIDSNCQPVQFLFPITEQMILTKQ